ncbi:MAG: ATP synthase subunit I [Clostridiaceae bacterium]|nr:ATP synthase subunit I [Clostridiaceae bacterium]
MDALRNTQMQIIKGVLIVNGCIAIIGLLLISPALPFLIGLLFGTIISILNFRLLYLTVNKAVTMREAQAKIYAASRYMLRYFVVGIVLYISIKADYINILGTILGIITLKIVILKKELFNSKAYFKNIFKRKEAK